MTNQTLKEENQNFLIKLFEIENLLEELYDKQGVTVDLISEIEPNSAVPILTKPSSKKSRKISNELLDFLPEQLVLLQRITENQAGHIGLLESSINKLKNRKQEFMRMVNELEKEKKEFFRAVSQMSSEKASLSSDYFITSNVISRRNSLESSTQNLQIPYHQEIDLPSQLFFSSHIIILQI